MQRAETALKLLQNYQEQLNFVTCGGEMGANVLKSLGFSYQTAFTPNAQETSSDDTKQAVKAIVDKGVDILLFAGGDGTARDVYSVVPENQLVLGIPAGVKIHSGVYAISPTAAGRVIEKSSKASFRVFTSPT